MVVSCHCSWGVFREGPAFSQVKEVEGMLGGEGKVGMELVLQMGGEKLVSWANGKVL